MSTKFLLQFGKLEAFIQEDIHQGNVVRVVALDITESVSSQIPGLRMADIGVHVRTINDAGQILTCYPSTMLRTSLPKASIELFNGRREGDATWQKYDEAWEKAVVLKERIIAFLEPVAAEKGFAIRPAGVIDIGETGRCEPPGNLVLSWSNRCDVTSRPPRFPTTGCLAYQYCV